MNPALRGTMLGALHCERDAAVEPRVAQPALRQHLFASGRLPPIRRRWAGVHAQHIDPAAVVHRARVADNAWLVIGPGGRGMTCSPAIAERTATETGL